MIVYEKQIIYSAKDYYIAFRKGILYKVSKNLKNCSFLCAIPQGVRNHICCKIPLLSRLFRLAPRAIIQVDDNCIIFAYKGYVYVLNHITGALSVEHQFPQPMRAPISFCKISGLEGFDDMIIYGEYHGNVNGGKMSVYARIKGTWSKAYTFEQGKILHIHGFCVDKKKNRVIMLTGDKDGESGFWAAYNNFKDVKPLLLGSQDYRSCVAFTTLSDNILYATDTPLKPNSLYLYNEKKIPYPIHPMNGPCIFATQYRNQYVFATTVEADSALNWYVYLLSTKIGPGIKDRFIHIIKGDIVNGFEDILTLKKDGLPYLLFEFGNATFCNDNDEHLIINPQSVRGYFQKSIIL